MKTSVIEVHDMLSVLSVDEVEKRIGKVPGVESVTVNYAAGSATVRYDETRLEIADIKSAVRQSGHESAAPATISEMKGLANGTRVTLTGKVVTCRPGLLTDRIYIEDPNETSGILVYGALSPPVMAEGSRVDVTGTLDEFGGERALTNAAFSNVQSGLPLRALSIPGRYIGGKQMGLYQMGVDNGIGLNNLGLLVRCGGVVTWTDFAHFYIDDGSKLRDNSGHTGLRVIWNGDKPDVGRHAIVTGISGCFIPDGTSIRVRTLRVRNAADIWPPL